MKQKTLEFLIEFLSNSNWKSSQLCLWRQSRIPKSSAFQKICYCKSWNRPCWFTNCEKLSDFFRYFSIFMVEGPEEFWRHLISLIEKFQLEKQPPLPMTPIEHCPISHYNFKVISLNGVYSKVNREYITGTPELKKSWWGKAFQCCKRNLKSALKGIV